MRETAALPIAPAWAFKKGVPGWGETLKLLGKCAVSHKNSFHPYFIFFLIPGMKWFDGGPFFDRGPTQSMVR
jgi:hypothetical protein